MIETEDIRVSKTDDMMLVVKEALDLFISSNLGQGQYRNVYNIEFPIHGKECVLKIENGIGNQNCMEWYMWNEVKHSKELKKWFSPCYFMSRNGRALIQVKTSPLQEKDIRKFDKIPSYFTDLKKSNYGMIGNQLVSHDYGTILLTDIMQKAKMIKPDWW